MNREIGTVQFLLTIFARFAAGLLIIYSFAAPLGKYWEIMVGGPASMSETPNT